MKTQVESRKREQHPHESEPVCFPRLGCNGNSFSRNLQVLASNAPRSLQLMAYHAIANSIQRKEKKADLPGNIQAGIGQLSGMAMNDAQVEQQLERRKPTLQLKGVAINDDADLEKEADEMGEKALQFKSNGMPNSYGRGQILASRAPVQRKVGFEIETLGYRIGIDGDSDDDSNHGDEKEERARALKKGDVLHQGNGWKLTPDCPDKYGMWTPEYIIAAIDETTNPEDIEAKMGEVADHAANNLKSPSKWTAGKGLKSEEDGGEILGNFQVTGGMRLSRIGELLKVLWGGDEQNPTELGKRVARAEALDTGGTNYKSVVALVAEQISDLVNKKKDKRYNGDWAKEGVGILSRTDLGAVVNKAKRFYTKNATFINEVLSVADVKGDTKLFKNELPGSGVSGNSIDDQQDLTARQWLEKLLTGTDYVWSSSKNDEGQAFGFDAVGETTMGPINHRAEGAVLELRGIPEKGLQSVAEWKSIAIRYARLFAMLNAKKPYAEAAESFRPKKESQGGAA